MFTTHLEPVVVEEDDQAQFKVEFEANPRPVIKWMRYTFELKSSDDIKIMEQNNSSTLYIKKACLDDTGIFTCLLENPAGSTKSSTNLTVLEKNPQTPQEESQESQMMESMTTYTSSSKIEKQQQESSTMTQSTQQAQQKQSSSTMTQSSQRQQQKQSSSAMIQSSAMTQSSSKSESSSKMIEQQKSNKNITNSTKKLSNDDKKKIENQKIMHVKKKDKIRIDIQFKDGSKSDLTFTHDGIPLTESNQDGIEITFSNDIATLTIDNADEKHSGLYQCIMKTEGGEARCSVNCQVE